MNRQGKQKNKQWVGGIEWTRVKGRPGFTWNAVQGCKHDCKWRMPDGTLAECYAKDTAIKFKSTTFFPDGFEHHYFNTDRLDEPLKFKEPAGIFLDSVADLMGHWVPKDHVNQVFDICRRCPQHIFQLLTKNAPRLLEFDIPRNVWVGVSAPPTFMFGNELTLFQQQKMVWRQLDILSRLSLPVRWMSIEPLSFDIAATLSEWNETTAQLLPLEWTVIGAASNGPRYYQPDPSHTQKVHDVLREHGVAIFHKGNLKWTPHLEEFPEYETEGWLL